MAISAAARAMRRDIEGLTRSGHCQPVYAGRGAAVERLLFCRGCARCDPFERVPQLGVTAGLLVGREITFEHALVDAERLDTRFDVLTPRPCELLRRWRHVALVEIETERSHADAAELNVDVRALGHFSDVFFPAGEDLLPPPAIRPDPEYAADMVQNDRRVGKGAGEVNSIRQLRVVLPRFEAELQLRELRKALAEFRL